MNADNPYQIQKEHGRFNHWLDGEYVGWISCENRESDRWAFLVFNQDGSQEYSSGYEGRANAEVFFGLAVGRSRKEESMAFDMKAEQAILDQQPMEPL